MSLQRLKLLGPGLALIPGLEGHKKSRVVTGAHKTEQAEADETRDMLDPGRVHEGFFHIHGNRPRPFQRSAVGKLHIDVEIPLMLVRKEAGWNPAGKKTGRYAKDRKQDHHHDRFSDQDRAPTYIAVGRPLKYSVKPGKKFP